MDVSLRRGHWLPSGGGGVDGVAGMLGILDWLSRHSNWLGLSTCSKDFLQCPWHPMTILGLKIFRAGRVPGRLLSQYQIAPALGGTNKRAGHSTADGLQPICSLSSAWLLAGPPGEPAAWLRLSHWWLLPGFASIQLFLSYCWLALGWGQRPGVGNRGKCKLFLDL